MKEIQIRFRITYEGFELDLNVIIPGHGVTAIFGPSGSGKTTLLRVIAGLEKPHHAMIAVNDQIWQDDEKNIFLPPYKRSIGYVFQDARLFPHLSVRQNLEYGMKRSIKQKDLEDYKDIVELLSIGHLFNRMPISLSGGERQRVGIARALLTNPDLLLMDEPLSALDQKKKNEVLPYLEKLKNDLQIPVLYVSHSADEVARLTDYIVVLEQGKILAAGKLVEILARIDLPIHLGEDTGVILEGIVAEHDAKYHLSRIDFSGGSLWVKNAGYPLNQKFRVRILARDVSVAKEKIYGTSILNTLPAIIEDIGNESHPALCLVRLRSGDAVFVARLTKRSADALALKVGMSVWMQIKAVAVIG